MKKLIIVATIGLLMSACTTMQPYTSEDQTSEGIRYRYGASKGIKPGDKVNAYKRFASGRRGYESQPIGTLTVSHVEETFSILKKDGEFELDGSTSLLVQ